MVYGLMEDEAKSVGQQNLRGGRECNFRPVENSFFMKLSSTNLELRSSDDKQCHLLENNSTTTLMTSQSEVNESIDNCHSLATTPVPGQTSDMSENVLLNSSQTYPSYNLIYKEKLAKINAENRRGVPKGVHHCTTGGTTPPNDFKHPRLYNKLSLRKVQKEEDNISMKGGVRKKMKKERKCANPAESFRTKFLKKGEKCALDQSQKSLVDFWGPERKKKVGLNLDRENGAGAEENGSILAEKIGENHR